MVIYVLKFKGTDQVYVGQSIQLDVRKRTHLLKLRTGKANYKLQKAYELYGEPELEVICEVNTKEELNIAEAEAFEIYDSINNGFNIAKEPDIHLEGDRNGASKYTNEQIRGVFKYLLDLNLRYKDIEVLTGVKLNTIRHIANEESHNWLEREFPEEYKILRSYRGQTRQQSTNNGKTLGIKYPAIKSPEGIEYSNIANACAFSREHNLDSSTLIKLFKGKVKSTKGWTLA